MCFLTYIVPEFFSLLIFVPDNIISIELFNQFRFLLATNRIEQFAGQCKPGCARFCVLKCLVFSQKVQYVELDTHFCWSFTVTSCVVCSNADIMCAGPGAFYCGDAIVIWHKICALCFIGDD